MMILRLRLHSKYLFTVAMALTFLFAPYIYSLYSLSITLLTQSRISVEAIPTVNILSSNMKKNSV